MQRLKSVFPVNRRSRINPMIRIALLVLFLASILLMAGCYRPLFEEKLPRHQYSEYDEARHGPQPTEDPDVFGNPTPALQRRLDP